MCGGRVRYAPATMRNHFLLVALALGAVSACKTTSTEATPVAASTETASSAAQAIDPLEEGRKLTAQFYAGEIAPIWARMNERMQSGLGSEQNLATFRQQVEAQLGTETAVNDEQVTAAPPYQVYVRTASFSKFAQPVAVQWAFEEDGRIAGFFVTPAQ